MTVGNLISSDPYLVFENSDIIILLLVGYSFFWSIFLAQISFLILFFFYFDFLFLDICSYLYILYETNFFEADICFLVSVYSLVIFLTYYIYQSPNNCFNPFLTDIAWVYYIFFSVLLMSVVL